MKPRPFFIPLILGALIGWYANTNFCVEASQTTEIEYRCYWWKLSE